MSTTPLLRSACALMLVAICLVFGAGSAAAQAGSGTISGVVTDQNGAAVPNATVTATNKETALTRTVTTSEDGLYTIATLPTGTYTVKANAQGFTETTAEVTLNVGRSPEVPLTLGTGGVKEEVIVTADAVQTTSNQTDSVLNQTAIDTLPINGRRFQDFVTLTPSAQIDPSRGQISLSGQRGINGNINVDGVDFNQSFFGGIRGGERSNQAFTIPQESIKEFQVVAAGYSAEFGRSSGGVVNVVTKSGTNEHHGSGFYLLRHKDLASKNPFIRALETSRGITVTPAPTQQQFGGSLGGPLQRDKLFYFVSYEQQRFRADRQVLFGALNSITRRTANAGTNLDANSEAFDFFRSIEEPFTQTNDVFAGLARADWQLNNDHRANFRYSHSQNRAFNANATGETSLDPTINRALSNNGTERDRTHIGVAQLVSTFGSKIVNELRTQYSREDRPRGANAIAPNVGSGIGNYGTRNFLPTTQFDTRAQVADSLTYIVGNHTTKFGGEFNKLHAEQIFGFNQTGTYNPGSGSNDVQLQTLSLTSGVTNDRRFDTTTATYVRQIGNLFTSLDARQVALFAQDSWRITPRLTVNYGLRVDKQYNPETEISNQPLVDLVRNANFPLRGGGFNPTVIPDSPWQFGPRLGVAWDPKGDGRTVIRAFAGEYFAATPLLLFATPSNNFRLPAGDLSVTLPFSTLRTSSGAPLTGAALVAFLAANPTYTSTLTAQGLNCTASSGANCSPNSIYRQFLLVGVNLNNFTLGNLPNVTPAQIAQIGALVDPITDPSVSGLAPIGIAEDYKNPQSFQWGGGIERQVAKGVTFGVDFAYVNTIHLQRNRELNLPAPCFFSFSIANGQPCSVNPALQTTEAGRAVAQALVQSGRPYYGLVTPTVAVPTPTAANPAAVTNIAVTTAAARLRPVPGLGSVQVRETTARSLYEGLNFRLNVQKKWGQINAFYTLSRSLSDDDNERDAGGVSAADQFDLRPEYNFSRLDRRHQFVANPVVFLPAGFEVSSALRFRSGLPLDAVLGTDLNGDRVNNDRPFRAPGVAFKRNAFRNRSIYDTDVRVQKSFRFGETKRLIATAEFFNLFNAMNIQFAGATVTQFCSPTNDPGCGFTGLPTNVNFRRVRENNETSATFGQFLLNNTLGSINQSRQVQLGIRFQF